MHTKKRNHALALATDMLKTKQEIHELAANDPSAVVLEHTYDARDAWPVSKVKEAVGALMDDSRALELDAPLLRDFAQQHPTLFRMLTDNTHTQSQRGIVKAMVRRMLEERENVERGRIADAAATSHVSSAVMHACTDAPSAP